MLVFGLCASCLLATKWLPSPQTSYLHSGVSSKKKQGQNYFFSGGSAFLFSVKTLHSRLRFTTHGLEIGHKLNPVSREGHYHDWLIQLGIPRKKQRLSFLEIGISTCCLNIRAWFLERRWKLRKHGYLSKRHTDSKRIVSGQILVRLWSSYASYFAILHLPPHHLLVMLSVQADLSKSLSLALISQMEKLRSTSRKQCS